MGSQKLYASYDLPTIKLQRPSLPSNTIVRERLIRNLLKTLERPSVHISIRAPLGFGKTILLSQLDATLTTRGWTTAWVRLDSFDTPEVLDAHLASIEKTDLLIVDDSHCLAKSSAETCIRLVGSENRVNHILLAGKNSLNLPDLPQESEVELIECEDLLFSPQETRCFCAHLMKRPCDDLADALFDLFVGWPLPTHFAMRELAGSNAKSQLAENLLASFRILSDLLASEGIIQNSEIPASIRQAASNIQCSTEDTVNRILAARRTPKDARSQEGSNEPACSSRVVESPLGDKEHRVLRLVANGLKPKEIAQELVISEQTVRTHLKNIYRKLGAHSRKQAIEQAIMKGLL